MTTYFSSFVSPYFWTVVVNQISIPFLVYSCIVPAILAIAFGTFLYLKTKKLSSFYLFLLCLAFAAYAIFDLACWFPSAPIELGVWSVLDIFTVSFFVFSYWFLYSFIKERDLPFWQKVVTGSALVPTLVITAMSINMNTFSGPSAVGIESLSVTNYNSVLFLLLILLIVVFSVKEYIKAGDSLNRKKIALAGLGVIVFLFIFFSILVVTNFVIAVDLWGLGANGYVYTIDSYSLFGMPILLAFLGYLIAKYQAFDIRLIKSVAYMVILMILLFVGLFFA